jgi:hypothetical protein
MSNGCISGTQAPCGILTTTATDVGGIIEHVARGLFGSSTSNETALTVTTATASGVNALQVNGNAKIDGTLDAATFMYTSDRRVKDNIKPLEDSLKKITALQPVSFTFKDSGRISIGFIAQDMEKIYPELVKVGTKNMKGIDYVSLVAPLVGAVQELEKQNKDLNDRLSTMEAELKELKKKN